MLTGVWTVAFLGQKQDSISFIFFWAAVISTSLILAWRFYVQYLDNEIAKNYKRIVYYEHLLFKFGNLPENQSAFHNITKEFTEIWETFTAGRDWDYQYRLFCRLIDLKRIGWRGHRELTAFSGVLIAIFFCLEFFTGYMMLQKDPMILNYLGVAAILDYILILLFVNLILFYAQTTPKREDFEKAI